MMAKARKPKLYVETSVIGHLAAPLTRDIVTAAHQRVTRQWWEKRRHSFELYCSEIVVDEAAVGDEQRAQERLSHLAAIRVLDLSREARTLAGALLKRKALPAKAEVDAFHVAIAAVNGMDYLLTWNCSHLANASLRPFMERVCKKAGYRCPIICTPAELLEG
jgi:predicted nucleic acid-binding protein